VSMLVVRASVGASAIHGMGCLAAEPIARGQVVWVFHEGLDVAVAERDLAALPDAVRAFLGTYAFAPHEAPDVVILCGDHARHINHSPRPNVVRSERHAYLGEYVAAVDIAVGDELTCDYFAFDTRAADKLAGHDGGDPQTPDPAGAAVAATSE